MKIRLLVYCVVCYLGTASSQQDVFFLYQNDSALTGLQGLSVQIDNDFFVGVYEDREYTGGGRFDFILPGFWFVPSSKHWHNYETVGIGMEVYTPNLTNDLVFTTPPGYDSLDRPFASWQYISWIRSSLNKNRKWQSTFEFQLGMLGGPVMPGIQNLMHDVFLWTHTLPDGWEFQIATKGKLGGQFNYCLEFPMATIASSESSLNKWKNIYLLGHSSLQLGHRNSGAAVGLELRNNPLGTVSSHGYLNSAEDWQFNWIAAASAHYIQHNSLLEGYGVFGNLGASSDPHVVSDSQMVRTLMRAQLGVGISRKQYNIRYETHWNSQEYQLQNGKSKHLWAAIKLAIWL